MKAYRYVFQFVPAIALLASMSVSFAAEAALPVSSGINIDKIVADTMRVPPYIPANATVTYAYDAKALKDMFAAGKKSLAQLDCDMSSIRSAFDLTALPKNVYSVNLEKGSMNYTLDFSNCSVSGYRTNNEYNPADRAAESVIRAQLNSFLASGSIVSALPIPVGTPVVVSKTSRSYPLYEKADLSAATGAAAAASGMIDASLSEKRLAFPLPTAPEKDDGKYSSIGYVLPYLFNGKVAYDASTGRPVGLSIEVGPKGVASINGTIISFAGTRAASDLMSVENLVTYFDKGGKSPYYSETGATISMKAPERVVSYFELYRNGKTERFLSTAIRMVSATKAHYGEGNFSIIASDYRIGNDW